LNVRVVSVRIAQGPLREEIEVGKNNKSLVLGVKRFKRVQTGNCKRQLMGFT
jgi:hypothetical protein